MTLRLHNTLTRRLEPFEPLEEGVVRMYTCGPTVYDRAHIGNFRAFTWEDLLRRYLRWKGYRVIQVMNLTDVDDKTIGAAVERGVSLREVTDPVIEAFFEDWDALGLERVEHNPRATELVPRMVETIRRLEAAGHTYEADGSVYFDISSFPSYGRLAGVDPTTLEGAGRTEGDEEYGKEDPRDFVLWKGGERGAEAEVASWDSPWGPGRPGWHLECSVMAMEYLGETLDIHTGGVDNIFPHHTNEMAQSEAVTGRPLARFWLHVEHLQVEGGKMSKSRGNFFTVPDLLEAGHRASAVRYLLLSAHHRSRLNFTLAGLEKAERSLRRLEAFRDRVAGTGEGAGAGTVTSPGTHAAGEMEASGARRGPPGADGEDSLAGAGRRALAAFEAAMDEDLNVSGALAAVFELVREGNALLDRGAAAGEGDRRAVLSALDAFDRVFGVLELREREAERVDDELRRWIERRLEARGRAREEGDYARADRIRAELEERGIVVEDTPEGSRWKLRDAGVAVTADAPSGD